MIPLAALFLDLAAHGTTARVAPGRPLVLRLECGPEEWWSFDVDPAVLGRDHLPDFEDAPEGRVQVTTFLPRKPGTVKLRGLRAKGTTRPTAEVEITVEVFEE